MPETLMLTPEQWAALGILGRRSAKARDELPPASTAQIDLLLRISGTIKVGADGQTTQTRKPQPEALLALILSKLSPDEIARLTAAIVSDFKDNGDALPAVEQGYADAAARIIGSCTVRTQAVRRGAVTGVLSLSEVNMAALSRPAVQQIVNCTRSIQFDDEPAESGAS